MFKICSKHVQQMFTNLQKQNVQQQTEWTEWNGWTDGRNGWTDGTDGRTDGQTDGTDGRTASRRKLEKWHGITFRTEKSTRTHTLIITYIIH